MTLLELSRLLEGVVSGDFGGWKHEITLMQVAKSPSPLRDKQHPSLISVKENLRFKFESLPKDHLHQYKVILEGNILVGSDLLENHLDKY